MPAKAPPNQFDVLRAMEEWVEKGNAPSQIVATRMVDGKPERTGPLCPYPKVAVYTGVGSTNDAANFHRSAPK